MAQKKGLGRGLSALIPENDMDFLRRVARGEEGVLAAPAAPPVAAPARKKPAAAAKTVAPSAPAEAGAPCEAVAAGESLGTTDEVALTVAQEAEVLAAEASPSASGGTAPHFVDIAAITPNRFQPRRQFNEEEMANLADSIREHGVLQPILLRETDVPGAYELVAGERRWRAAQRAELAQIPALIRVLDDRQSLELAIIENVQRHDISAIDTALAYQKLSREFQLSQEDIAKRVGKSRSAIANTMRLLDLPDEIRKAIEDGAISEGHGRALLGAAGDGARRAIFRRVVRDQLSVRDTERLAGKARVPKGEEEPRAGTSGSEMPHTQAEIRDLERHIEKVLGLRVAIRANGASGSMVIRYLSSDDLERLRQLLSRGV